MADQKYVNLQTACQLYRVFATNVRTNIDELIRNADAIEIRPNYFKAATKVVFGLLLTYGICFLIAFLGMGSDASTAAVNAVAYFAGALVFGGGIGFGICCALQNWYKEHYLPMHELAQQDLIHDNINALVIEANSFLQNIDGLYAMGNEDVPRIVTRVKNNLNNATMSEIREACQLVIAFCNRKLAELQQAQQQRLQPFSGAHFSLEVKNDEQKDRKEKKEKEDKAQVELAVQRDDKKQEQPPSQSKEEKEGVDDSNQQQEGVPNPNAKKS